jgi:type VI secretion system protein VasG
MAEIKRTSLFGKLNAVGYKTLEAAAVFCKMRGNSSIEVVHWLSQIVQLPDSDLHRMIQHFCLDAGRLAGHITSALDRLPRGAGKVTNFSSDLEEAIERAWVLATLLFGETQVRTGHLMAAFLKTKNLRYALLVEISKEFQKIHLEQFTDAFHQILAGSPEEGLAATDGFKLGDDATPSGEGEPAPAAMGRQQSLARFSVDLTAKARQGEIDPVVGRDSEIRQIIDILMRRRQNNPILTGEAGVGKTAVVEGFALRIVAGDVPPSLRQVTLRSLDIGLLQAGASMKGEFEQRLRSVIEEVQQAPEPVILFIDEVHTLVGAGGAAGTGDAANLLKPALARGTLRTVAATTWDEYKRHIEKDAALTRRFQVVKIDEPSESKAILMMRGIVGPLERHHQVQILDEAIEAAVRLSNRYITARHLPDKSVSLIDTACARVAVSQHAIPASLDDCRQRIQSIETELRIVQGETRMGMDHTVRLPEVQAQLDAERERLTGLEAHWNEEKQLVSRILEFRTRLRAAGSTIEAEPNTLQPRLTAAPEDALTDAERDTLLVELKELQTSLAEFQGESPLVFPSVDQNAIAGVVADWTGIPVGRMVRNEIEQILGLADQLEKRVIGQRHALDLIARRVQTSRAKIDNPNRPIGVFMLVGPSGTGKTETALALAEALYGGEHNLISINMSEFQEAHTVSTLKGSPPGYVGYGEGGILTEAVRRRPYSVVLLDEVEKAHSDVHEIFFQVFDKGWMEDAEGRFINFKNTIIILTSNAAQEVIIQLCKDPELMPAADGLEKAMRGPLTKVFPDALLNRLVVVPYYPISQAMLRTIIGLNLNRLANRIRDNHKVPFSYDDTVPDLIGRRCTELERGARMVDALITNSILPDIGREFLNRLAAGTEIHRVHLSAANDHFSFGYD